MSNEVTDRFLAVALLCRSKVVSRFFVAPKGWMQKEWTLGMYFLATRGHATIKSFVKLCEALVT